MYTDDFSEENPEASLAVVTASENSVLHARRYAYHKTQNMLWQEEVSPFVCLSVRCSHIRLTRASFARVISDSRASCSFCHFAAYWRLLKIWYALYKSTNVIETHIDKWCGRTSTVPHFKCWARFALRQIRPVSKRFVRLWNECRLLHALLYSINQSINQFCTVGLLCIAEDLHGAVSCDHSIDWTLRERVEHSVWTSHEVRFQQIPSLKQQRQHAMTLICWLIQVRCIPNQLKRLSVQVYQVYWLVAEFCRWESGYRVVIVNTLQSNSNDFVCFTFCFARFVCFYPRDAMLARVIAIATCPSVCPSVCHAPVLCQNEES